MKVGIFFGGQSREREVSFAGGRTVYDNLNKELFEPVPIFVDSIGNFILLDWQFVYKGTIRDFYPPSSSLPESPNHFQVYIESLGNLTAEEQDKLIAKVGKRIDPSTFSTLFDFAFLALHGPYGEDGNIQGILAWYNIPYSGAGVLSSAIGINKAVQKTLMQQAGFNSPPFITIEKGQWKTGDQKAILKEIEATVGKPFVVKPAHQGSSIGVSILHDYDATSCQRAINEAFFIETIQQEDWKAFDPSDKVQFIRTLTDIRDGIGLPVTFNNTVIHHPEKLLQELDAWLANNETATLESLESEETVLIEGFIEGKEFSCIVIEGEDGTPIALPPTEIRKGTEVFDYRSKYLPGMSRKITPIDLPEKQIDEIIADCERLYIDLNFDVYARIDGFITKEGKIFLNDPNTTSGMMPSSFFFHQAAEIGLDPSQFLTYIINASLKARIKTGKNNFKAKQLLETLDNNIKESLKPDETKSRVGVIMGGYSSERHISVESGRNIYEKLASSTKYIATPVFLSGDESSYELHTLPVNILLKDNADDIRDKIYSYDEKKQHPIIAKIIDKASNITHKYSGKALEGPRKLSLDALAKTFDVVFIALHGRPGEDGTIQSDLERLNIPYNGSGAESSAITINKYETNKILREHGVLVADHLLVKKTDWENNKEEIINTIEKDFSYPFIAKPADDGCSSAVKKIHNRKELEAFAELIYRSRVELPKELADVLHLKPKEEFSMKDYFLIEDLISSEGATHFLEITGGMLTHLGENDSIQLEVFEPSEALASGEVLSLEEKFLAGEGQNITPARYSSDPKANAVVSKQVRAELERVAKILNIEGYSRIDAFVRIYDDLKADTIIIEVNSLPGMTPATCIFHQCALNGYKPYDFIDAILTFGVQRNKLKQLSKA